MKRDIPLRREISRLRAELQHKDLLLQIANDTIRTMKATSDRDWATITSYLNLLVELEEVNRLRAESWRRS